VKAFRLLDKKFKIPSVKMCLLKNIPMGAGLGGGSSDAAFTLKLLNDLFELKLSSSQLKNFAAHLGSDCSFFIENEPCFVSGRGDLMQSIDLNLTSFHILVIHPEIEINTKLAYEKLSVFGNRSSTGDFENKILNTPVNEWKNFLLNDFEKAIFPLYPQLSEIKKQFYDRGALYASMSGSGSAIFGIFEKKQQGISFKPGWKVFEGNL